jgi:hypothetical protein
MYRFEVYANEKLIGHTAFEGGDPPMGVASGRFIPVPDYAAIQIYFVSAGGNSVPGMALSVRVSGGDVIACCGGVHLTDYSAELGPEGLEVSAIGIAYPQYQDLFPTHVAAYQARLR